jgi:hypothetical protein
VVNVDKLVERTDEQMDLWARNDTAMEMGVSAELRWLCSPILTPKTSVVDRFHLHLLPRRETTYYLELGRTAAAGSRKIPHRNAVASKREEFFDSSMAETVL